MRSGPESPCVWRRSRFSSPFSLPLPHTPTTRSFSCTTHAFSAPPGREGQIASNATVSTSSQLRQGISTLSRHFDKLHRLAPKGRAKSWRAPDFEVARSFFETLNPRESRRSRSASERASEPKGPTTTTTSDGARTRGSPARMRGALGTTTQTTTHLDDSRSSTTHRRD